MDDKHLVAMYHHVHDALRMLKIGDVGVIACTKEFSADDLTYYTQCYAFHKNKWFELSHDHVTSVLNVTRVQVQPWKIPKIETEEPEEP